MNAETLLHELLGHWNFVNFISIPYDDQMWFCHIERRRLSWELLSAAATRTTSRNKAVPDAMRMMKMAATRVLWIMNT